MTTQQIVVPEGYKLYTENTAHILLPFSSTPSQSASKSTNTNTTNKNKSTGNNNTNTKDEGEEAFLNPVQEFNRDLSVACIRVWSEGVDERKEKKWREKTEKKLAEDGGVGGKGQARKRQKVGVPQDSEKSENTGIAVDTTAFEGPKLVAGIITDEASSSVTGLTGREGVPVEEGSTAVATSTTNKPGYIPYKFTVLEALSATGLRSIRYAKEIPLVKYVIANDLSASAVEAIKRNVELNGLGPKVSSDTTIDIQLEAEPEVKLAIDEKDDQETPPHLSTKRIRPSSMASLGKVRVNEGDACALMYSHRSDRQRVDCVDLDPYGTAAPFIDAAVQCVNDDGLLCVTCTDLSVLATNNYPEKCFSNYGGIPVKAEYCHEAALRLVLHTVSSSAARYGRYIRPLLSLSIDFYVRLFIRIQSAPIEVKKAASKTSMFYVCSGCQSFYEQPLGKIVEKTSAKSGQTNLLFKQRAGPPVSDQCPECESVLHVAGPMWSGPIHDVEFATKALEHVEANMSAYGTSTRMKGMLTVAKEELQTPFYFTPSKISSFFHCVSPSLEDMASALLHAGHPVSRSHALAGSLKTTATRQDIHDIFRCWVKEHPVKADSISKSSPSHHLHAKEPRFEADFKYHPQSVTQSSKIKLVRYQQNPTPNWGPGTKAMSKRKREVDEG